MDRDTTKTKFRQILLTKKALSSYIANLAEQIKTTYANNDKIIVIVLLNGAKRFTDELFGHINDEKFRLRYLTAGSYNGAESGGKVTIAGDIGDVAGQEVLIADDIYDSGLTLSEVIKKVEQARPHRIRTCLLLEKQTRHKKKITIDFKAAVVPDCFVVGYGLDYNGQYRQLPFIAELDLADQ